MAKSQKVFQFDSNLQKKVQKHDPEHYLREEKMLMIMIWYVPWFEEFWDQITLTYLRVFWDEG